jgi:hypothetical protein
MRKEADIFGGGIRQKLPLNKSDRSLNKARKVFWMRRVDENDEVKFQSIILKFPRNQNIE